MVCMQINKLINNLKYHGFIILVRFVFNNTETELFVF